jgi:hypothetical protein
MRRIFQVAVLALGLVPAALSAQICRGFPALAGNTTGHLGVGATFFDEGKGFGAQATFGGPLFVQGFFNYFDFDNTTLSLKTVGAGVGYEAAASTQVSVCPGVVVSYGFGLEVVGIDVTTLQVAPGIAFGLTSDISPTVSVTPFAEAALAYVRLMADAGPFGDASEDDWAGLLDLGLGVGFNDRLTLRPSVTIPISEEDGNTLFNVQAAIALR